MSETTIPVADAPQGDAGPPQVSLVVPMPEASALRSVQSCAGSFGAAALSPLGGPAARQGWGQSLGGRAAVAALRHNRVDHVVTVPDWVQLSMHAQLARGEDGIRLLNVCSENQAVTIGAGLTLGGRRPLLVMQNQGLYNCINTLRAVCMDAGVPLVFMVGQFGREFSNFGHDPRQSKRTMVRILEPLLETLGLPFWRVDSAADLAHIDTAYATAHARRSAALLLVGTPMAWS